MQGQINLEANVLVVKKKEYSKIAQICVESFCFFNPQSVVKVHVDDETKYDVELSLSRLINMGRVYLEDVKNKETKWQIQKLDLICSLSGSSSLFMDADLRWNGPLPKIKGTTFFVNEYSLDDNEVYRLLLKSIFPDKQSFGSMKNTSIFSWGGYSAESENRSRIYEIERKISDFLDDGNPEVLKEEQVFRMSEQLALSLAVEEFPNIEIGFLKIKDGFKDGSFVESSYFGATGASF